VVDNLYSDNVRRGGGGVKNLIKFNRALFRKMAVAVYYREAGFVESSGGN
jgi:hypothetical protein